MSIIDYNTFNVKSFIEEVRKRPVLWDLSNEDYKNRVARQDAWMEICQVFAQDFQEKDNEDQLMIGRELQQKWKYIRDAYMRQIRHSAIKNADGSRYARTYIYAKYLGFLNLNSNDTMGDQDEEGEAEKQALRRRRFIRSSTSGIIKPRKWKSTARDTKIAGREETARESDSSVAQDVSRQTTDFLEKQPESMNDDVAFFKSLLPTLAELKPSQKLLFRIDVMKILHSYATEANRIDTVFLPASSNDNLHEEFDMSKVSPSRDDYE